MRIASNTGPLIALNNIGLLNLLHELFSEIDITEQIHKELLCNSISKNRKLFHCPHWFNIHKTPKILNPLLLEALDLGEDSVIQLAFDYSFDLVLIDERKGRKAARVVYDLNVIGTARILVEAKMKGLIPSVGNCLRGCVRSPLEAFTFVIRRSKANVSRAYPPSLFKLSFRLEEAIPG